MSTMANAPATRMDLTHLRREVQTALELAIVDFAPTELMERLAVVSGLLEALAELPAESPPGLTLAPATIARARTALTDWQKWSANHKKLA